MHLQKAKQSMPWGECLLFSAIDDALKSNSDKEEDNAEKNSEDAKENEEDENAADYDNAEKVYFPNQAISVW